MARFVGVTRRILDVDSGHGFLEQFAQSVGADAPVDALHHATRRVPHGAPYEVGRNPAVDEPGGERPAQVVGRHGLDADLGARDGEVTAHVAPRAEQAPVARRPVERPLKETANRWRDRDDAVGGLGLRAAKVKRLRRERVRSRRADGLRPPSPGRDNEGHVRGALARERLGEADELPRSKRAFARTVVVGILGHDLVKVARPESLSLCVAKHGADRPKLLLDGRARGTFGLALVGVRLELVDVAEHRRKQAHGVPELDAVVVERPRGSTRALARRYESITGVLGRGLVRGCTARIDGVALELRGFELRRSPVRAVGRNEPCPSTGFGDPRRPDVSALDES